ncbi:MAG: hypothetical protein RLZ12_957 [Bacillota bacterium]|jgi:hypothetical protein
MYHNYYDPFLKLASASPVPESETLQTLRPDITSVPFLELFISLLVNPNIVDKDKYIIRPYDKQINDIISTLASQASELPLNELLESADILGPILLLLKNSDYFTGANPNTRYSRTHTPLKTSLNAFINALIPFPSMGEFFRSLTTIPDWFRPSMIPMPAPESPLFPEISPGFGPAPLAPYMPSTPEGFGPPPLVPYMPSTPEGFGPPPLAPYMPSTPAGFGPPPLASYMPTTPEGFGPAPAPLAPPAGFGPPPALTPAELPPAPAASPLTYTLQNFKSLLTSFKQALESPALTAQRGHFAAGEDLAQAIWEIIRQVNQPGIILSLEDRRLLTEIQELLSAHRALGAQSNLAQAKRAFTLLLQSLR